jgi:putative flippase GtrA
VSIAKQGLVFVLVGLLQLVLDSTIFILLDLATGMPGPANLVGRICGAFLGYFLNAKFTFANSNNAGKLSKAQLTRFLIVWILLTTVSTALVVLVHQQLDPNSSYLAKPLIESMLAFFSFFISRHWIYR